MATVAFELVTDEEFEALDAAVREAEAFSICSGSAGQKTLRSCSVLPEPLKETNHVVCTPRTLNYNRYAHVHSREMKANHALQDGDENVLCETQKSDSAQAKDIEDIGSSKDENSFDDLSTGTMLKGRTAVRCGRRMSLGLPSTKLKYVKSSASSGVIIQTQQGLGERAVSVASVSFASASVAEVGQFTQVYASEEKLSSINEKQDDNLILTAESEVSTSRDGEECGVGQDSDAPLVKYRKHRGLSVTDITASEWCEQQVDFGFRRGEPRPTVEMVAGTSRHAELEAEVAEVVIEVEPITREDRWAVRLLSTLLGLQMLEVKGLAREVYVLGEISGVWMVGVIDELRLDDPTTAAAALEEGHKERHLPPLLVDTKTRKKPTPPSEAQKRSSRLQLMCYKALFDGLVAGETFAPAPFFTHFHLRQHRQLSSSVIDAAAQCGFPELLNLEDVVSELLRQCSLRPRSQEELLIRYEWQEDRSLLGQDLFEHEPEWMHERVERHLEWWRGLREAEVVEENERWKCRYCAFASICPAAAKSGDSPPRVLETTELRDVPMAL